MPEPIKAEQDAQRTDAVVDERVREVYKLLRKFKNSKERRTWLKSRERNWDAAFESKIWTDEEERQMKEKGVIPLTINDLFKGIQGSTAIATDQRPGIKFLPIGSGDLYLAELLTRAHDKVAAQNELPNEVFEFVNECKTGALSAIEVIHDKSKGDPRAGFISIGALDPTYLYYDMRKSRKSALCDTDIIKAQLITKEEASEKYEDIEDADLEYTGELEKETEAQKSDDYRAGEDNYTIGSGEGGPGEEPDKKNVWEIEAHLLKKVRVYMLWMLKPDGSYTTKYYSKDEKEKAEADLKTLITGGREAGIVMRLVQKRTLRVIVGSKLIAEMENPYGVDSEGEPIINIVSLVHNRARTGRPVGPTDFALALCRERNKRRAQSIHQATENLNAPIVTQEGYRFEETPHGTLLIVPKDVSFPPQRLAPVSSTAETANLEQVAKADIDDAYDLQDVMRGKIPPGDPSGRTILALQDSAGTMSRPFIRNLEQALIRVGKCEMSLILTTWTREMWERLIEPDEMREWVPPEKRGQEEGDPMNPQASEEKSAEITMKWTAALDTVCPRDPEAGRISILEVDVRIAAGSTMPTNRMAKQQVAADLVSKGIYDARAALDYIDDPKAEEIAKRIEAKEQAAIQMGMTGGK
jgi:hypothetical protein